MKPSVLLLTCAAAFLVGRAHAQLNLSGGITLTQEGGGTSLNNLSLGGTAIAKDLLGNGAFAPTHTIPNVNNGTYGNGSSWIGDSANSWVGVAFPTLQSIQSFSFGRDNTGNFPDRALGLYTLEYTTDPNAALNPNGVVWQSLGTLDYVNSTGPGTLFNAPTLRHRFNLATPVNATAMRLVTPGAGLGNGTAIDEFELYSSLGAEVRGFDYRPAPGFAMHWNGNDGANFDATTPATVPNNLALASNGAVPFASSELGVQIAVPFHRAVNLNDGLYGNANSWIGADGDITKTVGVMFPSVQTIGSIAFGRDNGNNDTDCCGGLLNDRWTGNYTIQVTLDGVGWTTVGDINLMASEDETVGGGFTGQLRHEFNFAEADGDAISALGVRIIVPATGIGPQGTAIDEIEVYGAVPEPGSAVLLLAGVAVLQGFRRRRSTGRV